MKQPAVGYVLITFILAALVSACATGTGAAPVDTPTDAPSHETRSDCSQILGTAFRSADERSWFEANCSKWPPVEVPNAASVQAPPECAAMRGRPYTSAEQRQWYLANCNGNPAPAPSASRSTGEFSTPNQPSSSSQPAPSNGGPPQTSASDRTDCNAIRGTAYRSSAERTWFRANCMGSSGNNDDAVDEPPRNNNEQQSNRAQQGNNSSSPPQATQPSSGFPRSSSNDRTDCYAISGTPYRSQNEQSWYLANCFPPPPRR